MVEKEVEVSLGDIKLLYEYFVDQYKKEGITVTYSKFVFLTIKNTPRKHIVFLGVQIARFHPNYDKSSLIFF